MKSPVTLLDDATGKIVFYPNWYKGHVELFDNLKSETRWASRSVSLFGKEHRIPRLEAWVSDKDISYSYSGQSYQGRGWPPELNMLKSKLNALMNWNANAVLLNRYRDGKDTMGYHSDDEPELGLNPSLAILSLGSDRDFLLRLKADHAIKLKVTLSAGSLLWMEGAVQHNWQHSLPKRSNAGERISCTFRKIT